KRRGRLWPYESSKRLGLAYLGAGLSAAGLSAAGLSAAGLSAAGLSPSFLLQPTVVVSAQTRPNVRTKASSFFTARPSFLRVTHSIPGRPPTPGRVRQYCRVPGTHQLSYAERRRLFPVPLVVRVVGLQLAGEPRRLPAAHEPSFGLQCIPAEG